MCSKCSRSVEQVLQCESCLNWYCGPCEDVNEAVVQFKCLHWFCLKCEPSVLKLVDKSKSGDQSNINGGAFQEAIVSTIVEQIKSVIQETKECFIRGDTKQPGIIYLIIQTIWKLTPPLYLI